MKIIRLIRKLVQGTLSALPAFLQKPLLTCLSLISRRSRHQFGNHLLAFAGGVNWKSFTISPREVVCDEKIAFKIVPHIGEFDFAALFINKVGESEMFRHMRSVFPKYEIVIDVGANVGVYTCFLSKLAAECPKGSAPTIVSIEPSTVAYARLRENLRINDISNVATINAAAGSSTKLVSFFEPEGHLVNGSILEGFARIFSDNVKAQQVLCLGADALEGIIAGAGQILIKLDAEGFEPQILNAWRPLIIHHRPDIIVEVLAETHKEIAEIVSALGYRSQVITDEGLVEHSMLHADPAFRDWLITPMKS